RGPGRRPKAERRGTTLWAYLRLVPQIRWWPQRDSNPCFVMVAFSPKTAHSYRLLSIEKVHVTETRRSQNISSAMQRNSHTVGRPHSIGPEMRCTRAAWRQTRYTTCRL